MFRKLVLSISVGAALLLVAGCTRMTVTTADGATWTYISCFRNQQADNVTAEMGQAKFTAGSIKTDVQPSVDALKVISDALIEGAKIGAASQAAK